MLRGEEMQECLNNAPLQCTQCCGGSRTVETMAPALNKEFCPMAALVCLFCMCEGRFEQVVLSRER